MYTLMLTLMLIPQGSGVGGTIHVEKMEFPDGFRQSCINTGVEWTNSFAALTNRRDGGAKVEAHAVCLPNAGGTMK